MTSPAWIIGQGGLLGSAVARTAAGRPLFDAAPIPWGTPRALPVLEAELDRFLSGLEEGQRWGLVWAAGAGVIASSAADLDREMDVFRAFLRTLAHRPEAGRGGVFLSSSASVYAGARGAPFDETVTPVPLNAYARTKLAQEEAAATILAGRVPLAVGRYSTLYGPGQKLSKPQGLVSQLCLQAALRRPISIFVPMDTTRDYLYVDDAARLAWAELELLERTGTSRTRILASERGTTIAELVRVVQQVSRVKVRVVQRLGATGSGHVRDLRLRSCLPGTPLTIEPLQTGVQQVHDDVWAAYQRGQFAPSLVARS